MIHLLATVSILLILATTPVVAAPSYVTGTNTGTVATYQYSGTTQGNLIVNITVTSASGALVSFTKDEYNPGGSLNNTHSLTVDVSASQTIYYFIAANLISADPLYAGSAYHIGSPIPNYQAAGKTWTANRMEMTNGVYLNYTWDKVTGLLLRWNYEYSSGSWENLTVIYVGSVGVPDDTVGIPIAFIGASVVLMLAVLVLYYKRRISIHE